MKPTTKNTGAHNGGFLGNGMGKVSAEAMVAEWYRERAERDREKAEWDRERAEVAIRLSAYNGGIFENGRREVSTEVKAAKWDREKKEVALKSLRQMAALGKDELLINEYLFPLVEKEDLSSSLLLKYYKSLLVRLPQMRDGRLPPAYKPFPLEAPIKAFVNALEDIPAFMKRLAESQPTERPAPR